MLDADRLLPRLSVSVETVDHEPPELTDMLSSSYAPDIRPLASEPDMELRELEPDMSEREPDERLLPRLSVSVETVDHELPELTDMSELEPDERLLPRLSVSVETAGHELPELTDMLSALRSPRSPA